MPHFSVPAKSFVLFECQDIQELVTASVTEARSFRGEPSKNVDNRLNTEYDLTE